MNHTSPLIARGETRQIGPYQVAGVLGTGATGVVYRCQGAGGSEVAVKTVRVASKLAYTCIRRELHALRGVSHPNIVRVLNQGADGGRPWFAMELLSGRTLHDVVLGEAQPEVTPQQRARDAVRIALGIAEGLAALHAAQLCHRDVKPTNVFLRDDGSPVLGDLGFVSRFSPGAGREVLALADEGLGTPDYMAPEQLRGDYVDGRADLYALGCLLYYLLVGRPPFTPEGASMRDVLRGHLAEAPQPPSQQVAGLDPWLDDLLLTLLAKDPNDRPASAEAVVDRCLEWLGERPRERREPRDVPLLRPPFVGRSRELQRLDDLTRDAVGGRGALVLLHGPSGAGKTRLLLEFVTGLGNLGAELAMVECVARGGSERNSGTRPLAPFTPLLESIADRLRTGELGHEVLSGVDVACLAAICPALAHVGQVSREPALFPADKLAERALRALRGVLFALSAHAPLAVVIDDLQWADELTLEFVRRLAKADISDGRLLVVVSYRSEQLDVKVEGELLDSRAATVDLGRLDGTSVGAIARGMMSGLELPETFVAELGRRSAGNPFFVVEYLRTAVAAGVIRRGDGQRLEAPDIDVAALGFPESLEPLIERRLDQLSTQARRVLDVLSVAGRNVDLPTVCEVLDLPEPSVLESLEELLRRQVIQRADDARLRLLHDRLQEVAYATVARPRRVHLHRGLAHVLVAREGDAVDHGLVGYHFERGERADEAFDHYLLGARELSAQGADSDALGLSTSALRLIDQGATVPSPSDRMALLRAHLTSSVAVGDNVEAEQAIVAALALREHQLPHSRIGKLAHLLAQLLEQCAWRTSSLLAGRLSREGDVERAELMQMLPGIHMARGRTLEMFAISLEVANLSDRTAHRAPRTAYSVLGLMAGLSGLHSLARRYFGLAHDSADPFARGHATVMHAIYRYASGAWDGLEAWFAEQEAETRRSGMGMHWEHLTLMHGLLLLNQGRDDEADGFFDASARASADRGYEYGKWNLLQRAELAIRKGELERARALLAEFGTALESESLSATANRHAVAARLALEEDVASALESARAGVAVLEREGLSFQSAPAAAMLADVLLTLRARGETSDDLASLSERSLQLLKSVGDRAPFLKPVALRARAVDAAQRGRVKKARRMLTTAIEQLDQRSMLPQRVLAQIALVEMGGDPARCAALAKSAREAIITHRWSAFAERLKAAEAAAQLRPH